MTAITPQQMRDRADEAFDLNRLGLKLPRQLRGALPDIEAALRAAADQLEAVERWLWLQNGHLPGAAIEDLSAILTADTAPQEDRDE